MNTKNRYMKLKQQRTTKWVVAVSVVVCLFASVTGTGVYEGEQQALQAEKFETSNIPYASTFKQYADSIGWPWERLAALAWTESHWNAQAKSAVGARGVMQLMPKTGEHFGLNDSTCWVAEDNIRAGVRYVQSLQRKFAFVSDSTEQWKFVVASYNSGPGYVFAARREARESGLNPDVWENVKQYIPYKETLSHVEKVEKARKRIVKEER